MAVTGRGTAILFCEGNRRSLDALLLGRLLTGPHRYVQPCGAKQGMAAYIEGYFSWASESEDRPPFVALRDRDFDAAPSSPPALLPTAGPKPIFMTHRSCIESYLLAPELLRGYWAEQSRGSVWQHGDAPSEGELVTWIAEAARSIAEYQAVRWALADLRPGSRWPAVPSRWTESDGDLPGDLTFDGCLAEGSQLVDDYLRASGGISPPALAERAEGHRALFLAEAFYDERGWEVWFHGKDLRKAMQRARPDGFSLKAFCEWAAGRIEWEAYTDLSELVERVKAVFDG